MFAMPEYGRQAYSVLVCGSYSAAFHEGVLGVIIV